MVKALQGFSSFRGLPEEGLQLSRGSEPGFERQGSCQL